MIGCLEELSAKVIVEIMSGFTDRTLNYVDRLSVKAVCEKYELPYRQRKRGKMKITNKLKEKLSIRDRLIQLVMKKEPGIDGILVTVGLCIIALLLCVVMKDSLQTFIETIVNAMTSEAKNILTGVKP